MATIYIKADTSNARRNIKGLDKDVDQFARSSAKSLARMEKSFRTLKTLGIGLGGFFSAQLVAGYAKELVGVADTYTNIKSRLDLVTDSQEDFNKAYNDLYQISRDTGTTLESNAGAFVAMSNALADASDQQIIGWLETLDQGLVVSGASAEEASRFMMQFNQAMAGGVVRAEEFNSMLENNPYIMNKVAKALDTTVGGLRKLMLEGELTSQVFTDALSGMSEEVEGDFSDMALTVERAWNDLQQVFNRIVSDSDEAGGGTNALAEAIADLADTAEEHRDEITEFLAGMVDQIPEVIEGVGAISGKVVDFGTKVGALLDISKQAGLGGGDWGIIGGILLHGPAGYKGLLAAIYTLDRALSEFSGAGLSDLPGKFVEASTSLNTFLKALGDVLTGRRDWNTGEWSTEILEDIDTALEDAFKDVDLESALVESFAEIDDAAKKEAQDAGEKAGKAFGSGMSKEAKKEMEKLQKDLKKDLADIGSDIFDLEIAAPGGDPKGAWNAILDVVNEYEAAAVRAAKAGNWDEARKNVEDMLKYLDKLPDKVEGAAPSDRMIAKQKEMIKYYQEMAQQHTSTQGQNQYLEKAYQAQLKLNELLKEQKDGASLIVDEEEARLTKLGELKDAQKILADLQKETTESAKEMPDELVDKTKLEEATTEMGNVKEATDEVTNAIGDTDSEVVKLGDTWMNVTSDVIGDLGRQTDAIFAGMNAAREYIDLLEQAKSAGPSGNGSGGELGFATGGVVPGFGGIDSIKAKLTPGEGVLTPLGMGVLGPAALSQLNVGQNPFGEKTADTINMDFFFNKKKVGTLAGQRRAAEQIIGQFSTMKRALS